MPNETSATGHDAPRQATTSGDNDFTLSIEEVSERYARAGHPRTIRTLQRYCASGHLDAQKVATTLGDKYLVTPQSVARHIAQIEELRPLDIVATDRDQPRPVATPVARQEPQQNHEPKAATVDDTQRQSTTANDESSRYVVLLERDNEFLRDQVKKKDDQITDLSKRFGETQTLLGAMQRMLAPLLGQADPFHAPGKREVQDAQSS
jgi:hypothetical protein